MTVEEQKRYLQDNLELVPLTSSEDNKEHVNSFTAVENGREIARYLRESAWDDDQEHNTKVYLIKDKNTNEIAFYFAMNCGILFSDYRYRDVKSEETEVFNKYVEAKKMCEKKGMSASEKQEADNRLAEALGDLWNTVADEYRVSELLAYAEDKALILKDREEHFHDTEELEHVQFVGETFPAIDVKFFGKNGSYKPSIELSFKLGVYIFWEIMVPYILKIANLVGCKYIYLFAADNSEDTNVTKAIPMWEEDDDPSEDDENDTDTKTKIRRLVNYYITELKFSNVTNYKVLKPHYESECYTLVQKVSELADKREIVWLTHTDEE